MPAPAIVKEDLGPLPVSSTRHFLSNHILLASQFSGNTVQWVSYQTIYCVCSQLGVSPLFITAWLGGACLYGWQGVLH